MPIASPMRQWIGAPERGALFVYTLVGGFFAGVLIELLLHPGVYAALLCALCALFALGIVRTRRAALCAFVVLSLCALGILRAYGAESALSVSLAPFAGENISIEGSIVRDPEYRDTSVRVVLLLSAPAALAGKRALVSFERTTALSFGDTLALHGRIEAPRNFETDSGRVFNYDGYLRSKGIVALVRTPDILSRTPGGFSLHGLLYEGKHVFEHAIDRVFREPSGGFLKGILLGNQNALSGDLHDDFVHVGLIHIVVLSGYNITLVATVLLALLSRTRRFVQYAGAALGIIAFVVMTGGEETAVRAGIMALLLIFAKALRRPQDILRALALAAFVMILWNPLTIVWSPSFALSFLATLGLILLAPEIARYLSSVPERFGLREILAATLATQAFVLPYILWMSGIISPVSIPLNLIVLPLMPFAMIAGFIAASIALVSPLVALLPAFLVSLVLSFIVFAAHGAARLPGSSFTLHAFPLWGSILLYALLGAGLFYLKRKPARSMRAGLCAATPAPLRK